MTEFETLLPALAFVALREYLLLVAAAVAISSLDDLLVDMLFLLRYGWRRLVIHPRHPRAVASRLGAGTGWMAIVVPAWDESAVIGPMLRHALATFDYSAYRIFVGTYANDPATHAVLAGIADPRVAEVRLSQSGPTTKADCLNALWAALLRHEAAAVIEQKHISKEGSRDWAGFCGTFRDEACNSNGFGRLVGAACLRLAKPRFIDSLAGESRTARAD